jgi:hypothetical protein
MNLTFASLVVNVLQKMAHAMLRIDGLVPFDERDALNRALRDLERHVADLATSGFGQKPPASSRSPGGSPFDEEDLYASWASSRTVKEFVDEVMRKRARAAAGYGPPFVGGHPGPPPPAAKPAWAVELGLPFPPVPTRDAIAKAFRELAKSRHPDGGGTDDSFIKLTNARDEALRAVGAR